MEVKTVKRTSAIRASRELRRKFLTPVTDRQNRSRQVGHSWPWPRYAKVLPSVSLEDELAAWEHASDEDYSSFESELD